jgi:hypothetical protein
VIYSEIILEDQHGQGRSSGYGGAMKVIVGQDLALARFEPIPGDGIGGLFREGPKKPSLAAARLPQIQP